MVKFKFNGQDRNFPTKWEEITIKQFLELKRWAGDDIELISILWKVPVDDLLRCTYLDLDTKLIPLTGFIQNPFPDYKTNTLTVEGKQYPIPKDLTTYTLGQKIAACNAMDEASKNTDIHDSMPLVVAIYMQPIVQEKEFSIDEAEKFAEVINECNALDVLNTGSFFLKTFLELAKGKQKTSIVNQIKNKSKQIFTSLVSFKNSTQSTP